MRYNPGLTPPDVKKITKSVGLDGTHFLNFSDFLLVVFNFNKYLTEENLIKLFNSIDKQRKGFLT